MPRYFFHVGDGTDIEDTLGMELSTLAAAKCEAVRYAAKLICDEAQGFWDAGEFQMAIADEKGLTLFSIALTLTAVDAPSIQVGQRA